MVRVKYCGITSVEDAKFASKLGISALGYVFADSKRKITVEKAREISRCLPPFVSKVGVFVNEDIELIQSIAGECLLNYIQLHGDEGEDYVQELKKVLQKNNPTVGIIKAFKVKDLESIEEIAGFSARDHCQGYLLDAYDNNYHGGTGKSFNWELFNQIKNKTDIPLILAGGLKPDNIFAALEKTSALGVDVSSGIESERKEMDGNGKKQGSLKSQENLVDKKVHKDHEKMKKFIVEIWRWQENVFW